MKADSTGNLILAYHAGPVSKRVVKRLLWWVRLLICSLLLLLGGWFALFTFDGYKTDPLAPRYVLWKHGWISMPKDIAFIAMGQDSDSDSLIKGLTVSEVQRKFGRMRRPGNLTPEQQDHQQYLPPGGDYAWIGDSTWVVTFKRGRGVSLRLLKG